VVAFLVSDDRRINAKENFDSLGVNTERQFRTAFDAWVDGKIYQKRYHGWDRSEYKGLYTKCFVFKYKSDRFYGILYNPRKDNPSYRACILIHHASKNEWATYEPDLKLIEEIRMIPMIQRVIENGFEGLNGTTLDRTKH
jgi:hypothetical protein